jgi:hypothetical protein
VYRHSTGTPRAILHLMDSICSQVDRSAPPEQLEKEIRTEINLKAGALAQTKIESEMASFLSFIDNDDKRIPFFANIHRNVLRKSDMRTVNAAVSRGDEIHPFCELYNLGLLGVLKRDADGELRQTFKRPVEFDWRLHDCMPESDFYILHPALEAYLSDRYRLMVEPGVLVDPGAKWREEWSDEIEERTAKCFVSYATVDRALRDKMMASVSKVLSSDGIRHEFWVDDQKIAASESITTKISEGIEWADLLIAIVTPDYLESGWCMNEMQSILSQTLGGEDKKLFPFIFGAADRSRLGPLVTNTLVPRIDESDAASPSYSSGCFAGGGRCSLSD